MNLNINCTHNIYNNINRVPLTKLTILIGNSHFLLQPFFICSIKNLGAKRFVTDPLSLPPERYAQQLLVHLYTYLQQQDI